MILSEEQIKSEINKLEFLYKFHSGPKEDPYTVAALGASCDALRWVLGMTLNPISEIMRGK